MAAFSSRTVNTGKQRDPTLSDEKKFLLNAHSVSVSTSLTQMASKGPSGFLGCKIPTYDHGTMKNENTYMLFTMLH